MQTYVPGLIIIIINNQSHLYLESDEAEIDIYAILKLHHSIICCFPLFRGLV